MSEDRGTSTCSPRCWIGEAWGRRSLVVLLATLGLSGCATLQEIANLRRVDFRLNDVSAVRLAGVDVMGVRSVEDLNVIDVGRITLAVARNELPLQFVLDVAANNPAGGGAARLTALDWTLLIEDRETISGALDQEYVIQPGTSAVIPVPISFDLIEFVDGSATDLTELVLSLANAGGSPKNIALRARPTIDTPLGPMRYPEPIVIGGQVGRIPAPIPYNQRQGRRNDAGSFQLARNP